MYYFGMHKTKNTKWHANAGKSVGILTRKLLFLFQIVGLIVPPLPAQSGADPHSAENRTKKQFGSSARAMLGDDYKVEAKNLERFLQLMLSHLVFGRDKHLEEFL